MMVATRDSTVLKKLLQVCFCWKYIEGNNYGIMNNELFVKSIEIVKTFYLLLNLKSFKWY